MKKLRDELVALGISTSKLEQLLENVETKKMYKVYIFYQFFDWEDSTEEEKFVLYTEDESLANSYFGLLQEVEEAFASSTVKLPTADYYTAKLEKVSVQNYRLEHCPFCGEPVDRSKGWYCPNCGSA